MKTLSLFSGVDSFSMAMRNLKIENEIIGFSEIDEDVSLVMKKIHGLNSNKELGDITKIKNLKNKLGKVDLITHGSPCQSFSLAGKGDGGEKGSNTKSSLMWYTVSIVEELSPSVVIWENVKNATQGKNKNNFDNYLKTLESLGYKNYFRIYKSCDFGVPQARERVFVVSLKEGFNSNFTMPDPSFEEYSLDDIIDNNGKYETPKKNILDTILIAYKNNDGIFKSKNGVFIEYDDYKKVMNNNSVLIKNGTKKGYAVCNDGDGIDFGYHNSKTRRGRVQKNRSNTLLTQKSLGLYKYGVIRYFTPLEYWRLQSFKDSDYLIAYNTLKEQGYSDIKTDKIMYSIAGNSITTKVLEAIFESIYRT